MNFKVGGIYKNPHTNCVIKVLTYDKEWYIIGVEYIHHEFDFMIEKKDGIHLGSPLAKGMEEIVYMQSPLWRKLEGK